MNPSRRRILQAAAASGLSVLVPCSPARAGKTTVTPRSTEEIQAALRAWPGAVSIGGGRFSQGGQIAEPGSLHLDLRGMNKVLSLDAQNRVIRVQAGIRWRDIQDAIDPHDLSVKIMQSFSNFTVGGALSVNCHGRYVGRGPLVNSARTVQLVTADSQVLELSRSREPELFRAVFGGYGGLGVVTEVELDLDANTRMERISQSVPLEDYPQFFRETVLADPKMVMHNADLIPPDFDTPVAISWRVTDKPVTESKRLVPRGQRYAVDKDVIWAVTELPGGARVRKEVINPSVLTEDAQHVDLPAAGVFHPAGEVPAVRAQNGGHPQGAPSQRAQRLDPAFACRQHLAPRLGAAGSVRLRPLLQAAQHKGRERRSPRVDA